MNILKRLFSRKEVKDSNSTIKKVENSKLPQKIITFDRTFDNNENYQNNLFWWNKLDDVWKRYLLSPKPFELDDSIDVTVQPTEEFLEGILTAKTFCSNWIPFKSIEPLNAMKCLEKLLLESVGVVDFSEISTMKNITTIHAGFSNTLESLDGLENFDQLQVLTLVNTDITSLKPIAALPNIIDLDIRGTLINPSEYEYFKQLHPNANIDFITPMNPLRRNKESLENSLLDFYRDKIKELNR